MKEEKWMDCYLNTKGNINRKTIYNENNKTQYKKKTVKLLEENGVSP